MPRPKFDKPRHSASFTLVEIQSTIKALEFYAFECKKNPKISNSYLWVLLHLIERFQKWEKRVSAKEKKLN